MSKVFKSPYNIKLPKSRHEVEASGGGKKGLLICKSCNVFYYQKAWHHNADTFISKREDKDLRINFVLCPACQMIKNNQYEGEVVIKNTPIKLKEELINLVKGYCRRAYLRDPLHRLIEIKNNNQGIQVTVTENELANKLAKKIKETFHKVKTRTFFTKEPGDVARVVVEFTE